MCKWHLNKCPWERSKPIEYSLPQGYSLDSSSVKSHSSKIYKARYGHKNNYWCRQVSLIGGFWGYDALQSWGCETPGGVLKLHRCLSQPSCPCWKHWERVPSPESFQWQWTPECSARACALGVGTIFTGQDTRLANYIMKPALFYWSKQGNDEGRVSLLTLP